MAQDSTNATFLSVATGTCAVLSAYGIFTILRATGVEHASATAAYVTLGLVTVLGVLSAFGLSARVAESLRGELARPSTEVNWPRIRTAVEDSSVFRLGAAAPAAFMAVYVVFATHHAVFGDYAPARLGLYSLIAFWLVSLPTIYLLSRFGGHLQRIPALALKLLYKPTLAVGAITCAFYLPELLVGTTTRQAAVYVLICLLAAAAGMFLVYALMFAGIGSGRLAGLLAARFCDATRRVLHWHPSAFNVINWFGVLMSVQIALHVGMAVATSAMWYSIARVVWPSLLFAIVTLIGLLTPLLAVVRVARDYDRVTYYQIPKTFVVFVAAYAAVVPVAAFLAYAAARGLALAMAAMERTFGAAVFPDFLYFFVSTPISELPLWAQAEGVCLGALAAIVVSWVAAVVQRRDWVELVAGLVVLVGATAVPAATGLFESDAAAYLQTRLPLTPRATVSVLISAIAMVVYRAATRRIAGGTKCGICNEQDIPTFARFCPTCGGRLDPGETVPRP